MSFRDYLLFPQRQATYRLSFLDFERCAMRVLVDSLNSRSSQLRRRAVRRTQFVMRRLGWLVPRARVQLTEVNGPRREVYKRCQVELQTDAAALVVITALARDWRSALDNALSLAARSVLWLWRRQHQTAMLRSSSQGH